MNTFVYRLWATGKVDTIKANDFNHAENKVRKIHKTDEFTVEMQLPKRNYY